MKRRTWSFQGKRLNRKAMIATAREWYARFGHLPLAISPTGRPLFAFLLNQVIDSDAKPARVARRRKPDVE